MPFGRVCCFYYKQNITWCYRYLQVLVQIISVEEIFYKMFALICLVMLASANAGIIGAPGLLGAPVGGLIGAPGLIAGGHGLIGLGSAGIIGSPVIGRSVIAGPALANPLGLGLGISGSPLLGRSILAGPALLGAGHPIW